MSAPNTTTTNWIRAGLLALPIYGSLTAWSSLGAQPDQVKEPEAWARYVSSTSYLVSHLIGSTGYSRSSACSPWAPTSRLAAPGAWGWRRWWSQRPGTPCSWCPP